MAIFDDLWNLYAYKVGKREAEKSFKKIGETEYLALFEGVNKYNKYIEKTGREKKHLSTYLNQRSWEDELDAPRNEDFSGNSIELRAILKAIEINFPNTNLKQVIIWYEYQRKVREGLAPSKIYAAILAGTCGEFGYPPKELLPAHLSYWVTEYLKKKR